MRITFILFLFTGLLLIVFCQACSNSSEPSEEHFEAVGLYVVSGQDTIVRSGSESVNGKIDVDQGTNTSPLSFLFVQKDGSLVIPQGNEWSLGWMVADTTVARVIAEEDIVNYILQIQGRKIGDTTIIVILKHGDHTDFESLPIPIHVQERVILPKG